MPKRPRQHVIETEENRAFENAIPAEWVIRQQVPDYSIDTQVQIFNEGNATPHYFFAQLKGSDNVRTQGDTPTKSFFTEDLRHWLSYSTPVMLVLFDAQGNRIFYDWVHRIYEWLSPEEQRKWWIQKSYSILFTTHLSIDEQNAIFQEVVQFTLRDTVSQNDVSKSFRLDVRSEIETEISLEIKKRLSDWIHNSFPCNFFQLTELKSEDVESNIMARGKPFFSFNTSKSVDVLINIPTNSFLTIWWRGTTVIALPIKVDNDSITEQTVDNILITIKLAIVISLGNSGQVNAAFDALDLIVRETPHFNSSVRFNLKNILTPTPFADSQRISELLDITEYLLRRNEITLAMFFSASFVATKRKNIRHSQRLIYLLKEAIEIELFPLDRACLQYNLANTLRNNDLFRKAIKHYRMASIDNPAYLEKSYWWAEVAGCFFSLGKLTWSEHCYRQAAALGEEHVPVKFLLGDVLLYKGYFTDAAKAIKSYLAGVTIKRSDAILKCWLANELSNMFDRVDRHIGEAVSLVEEAIQDKSDPFYIQIIENAIRLDPLCGAAWYRLSVHGLPNWGNQSYECWLITAILLGDNITAWAFSILSFINETPSETLKKDEFVLAIITEAVQKHGVKLEQELFKITLDSKLLETVREVSEFGQHYFQVDLGFQLRQF